MRYAQLLLVAIVLSLSLVFVQGRSAYAAFHCMRIHAVMAGFDGDNNVQYVELRMDLGGQIALLNQQLKFYDASGILKATFTFPNSLPFTPAQVTGDSILIATTEFNDSATGGAADFTFAGNTVGSNGGDPLHPVQSTGGKVAFAEAVLNCAGGGPPVDSIAYGAFSGTVDYGSAAVALPSPSDDQALRLGNLNTAPANNSTEYSLQPVSTNTFSVAASSLSSDLTSPRNNSRTVLQLQPAGPTPTPTSTPDPSVGGIAKLPKVAGTPLEATGSSDGNAGLFAGVIAVVVAGAGALGGAAWYVRRRPA